jgi:hypothetical protein
MPPITSWPGWRHWRKSPGCWNATAADAVAWIEHDFAYRAAAELGQAGIGRRYLACWPPAP